MCYTAYRELSLISHCEVLNKQASKPSDYTIYKGLPHIIFYFTIPLEGGLTDVILHDGEARWENHKWFTQDLTD